MKESRLVKYIGYTLIWFLLFCIIYMLAGCGVTAKARRLPEGTYTVDSVATKGRHTKVWLQGVERPVKIPANDTLRRGTKFISSKMYSYE
jgi:hypothetical protein